MPINYPDAGELLDSLSEMLQHELQPKIDDKELKYKIRVAVNIIKTIQREIKLDGTLCDTELQGLQDLHDKEGTVEALNIKLCDQIRNGKFDSDARALLEHLTTVTLTKIEIDNPSYPTYLRFKHTGNLIIP